MKRLNFGIFGSKKSVKSDIKVIKDGQLLELERKVKSLVKDFVYEKGLHKSTLGIHKVSIKVAENNLVEVIIEATEPGLLIGRSGCVMSELVPFLSKQLDLLVRVSVDKVDPFI